LQRSAQDKGGGGLHPSRATVEVREKNLSELFRVKERLARKALRGEGGKTIKKRGRPEHRGTSGRQFF